MLGPEGVVAHGPVPKLVPGPAVSKSVLPVDVPSIPLVPLLPFGLASDYLQIAPGTYRVRITRAGSPSEVLVDVGSVTLSGGAVRTLLVTDAPGGGFPTGLSVIVDAG